MRALFLILAGLLLAGCVSEPLAGGIDPAAVPAEEAAVVDPGWPDLEAATVRPGVQLLPFVLAPGVELHDCTSNFVFRSPDNASLYLGTAAHCIDGMNIGDAVSIADGAATGTLAYSSWATMDEIEEKDETIRSLNDFALVRIDNESRAAVHPAMLRFGGPVGLLEAEGAAVGDKVLSYGNSALRMRAEPTSWKEGMVRAVPNDWTYRVHFVTPGIPGDSGSGAMTADGRALGVVVTLGLLGGDNGVTSLARALEYARDVGGVEVELVTWDLLSSGVLPIGTEAPALPASA